PGSRVGGNAIRAPDTAASLASASKPGILAARRGQAPWARVRRYGMASREESYWSRFTKSGGRERDDAQDVPPPVDAAPELASALGPPPGSGMPRPPVQDVNVTLTRPAPPPPAAPPPMAPSSSPATEQIETVIGRESAVQGTIRSEHSI